MKYEVHLSCLIHKIMISIGLIFAQLSRIICTCICIWRLKRYLQTFSDLSYYLSIKCTFKFKEILTKYQTIEWSVIKVNLICEYLSSPSYGLVYALVSA